LSRANGALLTETKKPPQICCGVFFLEHHFHRSVFLPANLGVDGSRMVRPGISDSSQGPGVPGRSSRVTSRSSEQPPALDVLLRRDDKEKSMYRLSSLLFAALLVTSASAFAGDTPDPSASQGEPALPSGSKADAPSKRPASDATNTGKEGDKNAVETTPAEEAKGKPKVEE
jgi:hypothetical protein